MNRYCREAGLAVLLTRGKLTRVQNMSSVYEVCGSSEVFEERSLDLCV